MLKIGKTIRRIRLERDLSQGELAEAAGVTASYLSLLERDKRIPSLQAIDDLAAALKVPSEILLWDAVEVPSNVSRDDRKVFEAAKRLVRAYFEQTHEATSKKAV